MFPSCFGNKKARMSRRSKCPWTHWVLAILAMCFLTAAALQVVSGAVEALWAAKVARELLERDREGLARLTGVDDLAVKRSVQAAFRQGGLYVPLEDVILKDRGQVSVWLPVPFRVPWVGSFVYGMYPDFTIDPSARRAQ